MKSRRMNISRTALFVAVFVLAGWSALYAQSTNWRDYLESGVDANRSYNQETAQRRMAAATDPRYRDIDLVLTSALTTIKVKDISGVNINGTFSVHGRNYTGREIKNMALAELDTQISENFRFYKISTARQSYSYTPSSAEDRSIEEIAQRVRAAGNSAAALRIMTSPPVSTKIEQIGITPQVFVTRLREAGINDADITRAAMNIEYIVEITGPLMDNIIRYVISFYNTPCMVNSVLRRLVALRVNAFNDSYVIKMFLGSISTDLPNSRFMSTAQVLEFLDRNGRIYLYESIRLICSGNRQGEATYVDFITFCDSLQLARFRSDEYFNRIRSMGFTSYNEICWIMIACQDSPSSFNGVFSWNQSTINRVKRLDGFKDEDWNTLRSIVVTHTQDFEMNGTVLVKYIGSAANVTIPAGVTAIGNEAFYKRSLTSITIPLSVRSIGNYAFADCSSLTSITIPSSVTSIGDGAFERCERLTNITVDTQNPSYSSVDGVLFNKNRTALIIYPASKQGTNYTIPAGITSIGNYAFYGCERLTSITIPSSVTSIGNDAFLGCSSLTSVTIPSSVTSIGVQAFMGCGNLTSVTISRRTTIGANAFPSTARITYSDEGSGSTNDFQMNGTVLVKYNGSAANVTIPAGVTAIGNDAFKDKNRLTSITIPSSVTSIGNYAFISCTSLTGLTIPSSVTSIGEGAFSSCSSLTSITIPSSVTSIGNGAFSGCTSLTSVTVDAQNREFSSVDGVLFNKNRTILITYPAGKRGNYIIPSSVTSIGNYAFISCTSLTGLTIPSSVTSIGEGAFLSCSSLTSVIIPSSVTSIGEYAFNNCTNLKTITVSRRATIGNNAFPSTARITYSD